MKKKNSRDSYLSIRQKLIAAVAMLLVATFMVASSSYAWFTLSTAPEVTGVYTAVGANGSLEMALLDTTTAADLTKITASAGNTGKNETWGNLVDLSQAVGNQSKYGLDKITLMPAIINPTTVTVGDESKPGINSALPLKTVDYESDGRSNSTMIAASPASWMADAGTFKVDPNAKGVVALGTSSTMTPQQIAFANYKSTMSAKLASAQLKADDALEAYADKIGLVISRKAFEDATDGYDINFATNMIAALESANADLLEAIKAWIAATAITQEAVYKLGDDQWPAAKAILDGITIAADGSISVSVQGQTISIAADQEPLATYNAIKTKLDKAKAKIPAENANNTTYTNVAAVLFDSGFLVYEQIKVNGKTFSEVKTLLDKFKAGTDTNNEAMNFGMDFIGNGRIEFPSGSGVYADFADLCGDYQAIIKELLVKVPGFEQGATVNNVKLIADGDPVKAEIWTITGEVGERGEGATSVKLLTNFYGYRLDFAFRTNASNSHLMLQTDPIGRIYSTGGTEETMGKGSTMTFAVSSADYTIEQAKKLMTTVRIIFTDAKTNEILAVGALCQEVTSANDYTVSANNDAITSSVYLYNFSITDEKLVLGGKIADTEGKTELTALNQNEARAISVYVYMDGDELDNTMVAAESESKLSVSGNLNLQFSSDAELVPMDYAPLKDQTATEDSSETTETQAPETSDTTQG